MAAQAKDYYKVLGIPDNAGTDQIKKAYRGLAKKYHPDANAGDLRATERFKEVSEAHGVLSDPDKRKKYDRVRKYGGLGAFGPGPGSGQPGRGGGFKFEDLSDLRGVGGIFSSIFDFGKKARSGGAGPERGRNVEYLVTISLRTAARGGSITVTAPVAEECATCRGTGSAPGTSMQSCAECDGKGEITFGQGSFAVRRPCPVCVGRGKTPETPCPGCMGHRQVRARKKVRVKVPGGVETGSLVRLPGEGDRSPGGGPPGDLIIKFRVKGHSFFTRDRLNLQCKVTVNIAQAILGSRIRVRTIDDSKVVLNIPPGTQSGTTFRIPGHGLQRGEKRGDQLVTVAVETPSLSEEGLRSLEDLAKREGMRH